MAKPPRNYSPTGWYHVFNRGARRSDIFLDRHDRSMFLELLESTTQQGAAECHAYALMGNHYHLLLRAEGLDISSAMNWLAGQYVQKFNKRHGIDGPMFRSRFGSTAIFDTEQLLHTVRYIHRNPLDLWQDIEKYEWSSHGAYLGAVPSPSWLETNTVLAHFTQGTAGYRDFIELATPLQQSA